MSISRQANIRNTPDNIYYNITIPHDPNYGTNPSPMNYSAYKTIQVLDKASDYYCAVTRFTIPLTTIPIAICPITPTNGNIYNTGMFIGIRNLSNNIYYPAEVLFTPEVNLPAFQPVVQQGGKQIITPFHYIYSIETMINMFNNALFTSFNAFVLANPLDPRALHLPPLLVYDATTTLISLIVHQSWSFNTSLVNPNAWVIYMNQSSAQYFDAMPQKIYFNNINNQNDYVLLTYNNATNGYPTNTFPALPTYLKMTQNYSTIFLWSPLHKILITSNSIPVVNEQIPLINFVNPDQSNSFAILADFVVQGTEAGDSRELAFYNPSGQYKLIDLASSTPLNKLTIEIYWQDTNNNIYPLMIGPNDIMELKLAFVKKDLYKKELKL